jgi:hypothetical protein
LEKLRLAGSYAEAEDIFARAERKVLQPAEAHAMDEAQFLAFLQDKCTLLRTFVSTSLCFDVRDESDVRTQASRADQIDKTICKLKPKVAKAHRTNLAKQTVEKLLNDDPLKEYLRRQLVLDGKANFELFNASKEIGLLNDVDSNIDYAEVFPRIVDLLCDPRLKPQGDANWNQPLLLAHERCATQIRDVIHMNKDLIAAINNAIEVAEQDDIVTDSKKDTASVGVVAAAGSSPPTDIPARSGSHKTLIVSRNELIAKNKQLERGLKNMYILLLGDSNTGQDYSNRSLSNTLLPHAVLTGVVFSESTLCASRQVFFGQLFSPS